jgi:hypothetical protein
MLLEQLKSLDPQTFYLIIAFMVIAVMTLIASIHTATRVDKMWGDFQRQKDIEQIKREVKAELKSPESPKN